jgi:hypothetical protein
MALTDKLTAIGDAIREKNGTTELIPLADMPQAILDISGGGETVDLLQYAKTAKMLFHSVKSFPSKAVINLPNVYDVYQAFAYWNTEPIPIVEELTVNAPNINVGNMQSCMGQMFSLNHGVKKVILNMPDESQYMNSTFSGCGILEEVALNFSTKKISDYMHAFASCKKLKKIDGVLDFSSATNVNYMFGCNELEYVRFAPNTLSIPISLVACSKLTSESIQSIIDGLATVETEQKLTLHTTVISKLTEEQVTQLANKNWVVV